MLQDLLDAMESAVSLIRSKKHEKAMVIHHNDTDGLSSASIVLAALEQVGITASHFSLEKPYPQVLQRIFKNSGGLIIFADFAGKIAPYISQLNEGRNTVLILDHHPAEYVDDPTVMNLDGDLYGLQGDRDISASATCFLFAGQLLKAFGFNGDHLAHLGILGAVGDGFFVDGALSGVNRSVMEQAVGQGLVTFSRTAHGEHYTLRINGTAYPAEVLCEALDTLGGVGYYEDGASLGLQVCMEGIKEKSNRCIQRLQDLKNELFQRELIRLRREIRTTRHIQWFDAKNRFQPMGIKMIGVFCSEIRNSDFLDPEKYLAGFQHIPNTVPGFGDIHFGETKISMRVSDTLTEQIRSGRMPGLNRFLPEATSTLGGFADACHSLSAATTVQIGEEELLIDGMEKLLTNKDELI